ncbi:MAG: RnfABCDGE type electron transport complex subunit D [Candidatus Marinimicrobia bacterium]|nr:RnfABCDGE type electron transport complex subunit D [Candidatus Neomarinimicrobiota bacterium]
MKLIVSSPPHWHAKIDVAKIHLHLIIALIPAVLFSVYTYGIHSARVIALAVATAVISEILIRRLLKKPVTIDDGSAILIGLLFAMIMPTSTPYWLVVIGTFLSIFIGREIFGGLGCNPMNPVIVGWAITRISWPNYFNLDLASVGYNLDFNYRYPLALLKSGGVDQIADFALIDLLLGKQVGGLGSAAAIFLVIGGVYILYRGFITWEIPLSFTVGVLAMASIFWLTDSSQYANPVFHLLTGNVIIGIFFLATDFSSSPFNRWGMIVFGLGCGILTIILRIWSIYPDGVLFAILIMNLFTPLLDKIHKKPLHLEIKEL